MSREAMKHALEALELLARYENPSTKIQVRKPKDGGPIVTMYPHKVATEAAALLRESMAQPEQEPVAHTLNCVCGAVWDVSPDGVEEMVHTPNPTQRKLVEQAIPEAEIYKREWQGLTDEDIDDCEIEVGMPQYEISSADLYAFARSIEAKLKEKNHG